MSLSGGLGSGWGSTRRCGKTTAKVASGSSNVARPIAANPQPEYRPLPIGAPIANAVNSASPIHTITLPAFWRPASPTPQLSAPVMTKLSMTPSSARPTIRIITDVAALEEN
jgi:hypothetical protein